MQIDADKPQPKPKKENSAITDYEREQLRDLLQHPGWGVYQRVIDGFFSAMKTGTEAVSMQDPLGNAQTIANSWAYFRMMSTFRASIEGGVNREIEWLKKKDASQRTPEQEIERRRAWYVAGEIGEPPADWEPRKH